MIGNPKFKVGDVVKFTIRLEDKTPIECVGTVEIVDRYGTFEQNKYVSYDIMVDDWHNTGEKMLVKHVTEQGISKYEEDNL